MSKKKLCFIVNSLKNKGGTERVLSQLANDLSVDYDVTILNRDTVVADSAFDIDSSVEIKALTGGVLTFLSKTVNEAKLYDFVVVHNMGNLTPALLLMGIKGKVISVEHSSFLLRSFFLKLIVRKLYYKLSALVLVNNKENCYYSSFFPERNVYNISNPLPFSGKSRNSYDVLSKNVIAVGRLSSEKNFTALIKAWWLLGEKTSGWTLNIYGDGGERKKLERLIYIKNLDNVFLKGAVEDVASIYKNSSFLVLTSKSESFGLVLVEALYFGLPVISFDCPTGPATIVSHNVNGLLVDNQNLYELSVAMQRLIDSSSLRIELSNNSSDCLYKYKSSHILMQWKEMLSSIS